MPSLLARFEVVLLADRQRAIRRCIRQALFTPDGNYLFTGARKENDILCWDIRNTSRVVMRLSRLANTNQHIHFDIDPTGKYLITGSQVRRTRRVFAVGLFVVCASSHQRCRPMQDARAYVYDLQTGNATHELLGHTGALPPPIRIRCPRCLLGWLTLLSACLADVVNSAAFHPFAPLVATATGDRKYAVKLKNFDDEDEDDTDEGARATGDQTSDQATTRKGKEKEEEEEEEDEDAEAEQRRTEQNVLALWCQLARRTSSGGEQ